MLKKKKDTASAVDIVKFFCEQGGDPAGENHIIFAKEDFGCTALHLVTCFGSSSIFETLLNCCPDKQKLLRQPSNGGLLATHGATAKC